MVGLAGMSFLETVGWPKVVLLLGGFVLVIVAWVLFPEVTVALMMWIEGLVRFIIDALSNFGGSP